MIKAIFFDLDGTLLNSNKQISEKTMTTLSECKKRGIKLFIATARLPLLRNMLSWDDYTLSLFYGGSYCNGSYVVLQNHIEYMFIKESVVQSVINYITEIKYDQLNIALQLENNKHSFWIPLSEKYYFHWGVTNVNDDIVSFSNVDTSKIVKMLIYYSNFSDTDKIIENEVVCKLESLCEQKAQVYLSDKGKLFQITKYGVNKYTSIERIRTIMQYQKDEIAVFGDDTNDIEMLSAYKYSFAMGNAEQNVKDSATFIIKNNDSDGIHYAIQEIIFALE